MNKLILVTLAAASLQAGAIYRNTTNNTGFVDTFFDNGLTEAGDQIQFGTGARLVKHVQMQVTNVALSSGTSDVTLRFYGAGAGGTLGAQIGPPATLSGVAFGANSTQAVDFMLDTVLPDEVIWTASFSNFGPLILGLNVFDPPTIGASSPDFYWWNTGAGLAPVASGFGNDNYYLLVSTDTALPAEPGSVTLLGAGIAALVIWRRARAAA